LKRKFLCALALLGLAFAVRADDPAPGEPGSPKDDDAATPAVQTEMFNQRGILTPRGSLVLEPSFQYIQSSVSRVALEGYTILPAITIGLIDVREVSRVTYVTNLAGRLGLSRRLEFEGRIPYVYRSDQTVTRPLATPSTRDDVFDVSGAALGDIEGALRYQFNFSAPYFIGNLRVRIPTGSDPFRVPRDENSGLPTELPTGAGMWAFQPSITFVHLSDPAVIFGNLSYIYTVERNVGGVFGRIDPGDVVGLSIGSGFALNQQISLSFGFEHNTVLKTTQNGVEVTNVRNLSLGSLLLGYSYRGTKRTVSVSLSAGVTADAPDVQLTLRVPFTMTKGH